MTNYDFMPSVLSLLGLPMPEGPPVPPGRDFSPTLVGKALRNWTDQAFLEFENVRAIRTRDWKYVERLGEEPEVELFDLKADPDELHNVADVEAHATVQKELQQQMHAWFARHADPKFDLWIGGGSQSHIATTRQIANGIEKRKTAEPTPP